MNLDELYQEIILDHFKNPRHLRKMDDDEPFEEAFNPNCGDQTRVLGHFVPPGSDRERIAQLEHHTKGCAISIASASIMCDRLAGKSVSDTRKEIRTFIDGLHERVKPTYDEQDPIAALLTVKQFPMRIHCATLSWEALEKWLAAQ